jgi:LPXTG-site transpeptidase (sortase) family protein
MSRSEVIRFLVLRSVGNFLVLVALYGVFATFGPAVIFQIKYELLKIRGVHFAVVNQQTVTSKQLPSPKSLQLVKQQVIKNKRGPGFIDILVGNKEQILTPIDPLFSILIPKLAIDERVVSNVSTDDPNSYLPVLQHAIAHAKGSVFPGDPGTTYLFAHSADNWWDIEHYNAVFYTLSNLSVGDEIDIFYESRRYKYVILQQIISDPQDVTFLTEKHEGPQQLVLQTCWPPGTTWKRLYIVAKPKSV